MDTKYWGPSGWRLLHLITFAYPIPTVAQKKTLGTFFSSLPYVLPCKFCRYSLSGYIQELPLEPALESKEPYALAKWLWRIHNKVNEKLRSQRLPVDPDPPFSAVKEVYNQRLVAGCTKTKFEGWEFLFSVVENHPYSRHAIAGTPIKDAPVEPQGRLEKNKWNVLEAAERLKEVIKFWTVLPDVLPYKEWRDVWINACGGPNSWATRAQALETLWGIRCRMESDLKLLNQTTFSSLCKELRTFRSGCSKSKRAKTCRRKRKN